MLDRNDTRRILSEPDVDRVNILDYKQRAQTVKLCEEWYHQLFLFSPTIRLIINPETGNIMDANKAAEKFYGYTMDELLHMSVYDLNCIARQEVNQYILKVRCSEQGQSLSLRHKLKNGRVKEVEVHSVPVNFGNRIVLNTSVTDVSERKKIERELQEKQQRCSIVAEGINAGIWDYDLIRDQVFYDRQWKAILGYEEHEIGYSCEEWQGRCHCEDSAKLKQCIINCLQGKSDRIELTYRMRHKEGHYLWILTIGKIYRNQEGNPIRWVGFNLDITHQKAAEELYLSSEEKLRNFAQAVPDVSFILDEDGRFIEAFGNEKLLAMPKEQYKGKMVDEIMESAEAQLLLGEVRRVVESGKSRSGVYEITLGHKKVFFKGLTVPMSFLSEGKRTAAIIATDFTRQLRTKRALQITYELRRRSDLINDIISGVKVNEEKQYYLEKIFENELDQPLFCCVILSDKFKVGSSKVDFQSAQVLKENLIGMLSELKESIAWECREGIGVLCKVGRRYGEQNYGKEFAKMIKTKIVEYHPKVALVIGVSQVKKSIESLAGIYRQAYNAALAAQCRNSDKADIVHFSEAGIFQLIPQTLGQDGAKGFIEEHIGKILEYDREKGSNLFQTLEAILEDNSVREIADKLHLHPKTVVFRHKRIETILDVSLKEFETKLTLALAIKLYKLSCT